MKHARSRRLVARRRSLLLEALESRQLMAVDTQLVQDFRTGTLETSGRASEAVEFNGSVYFPHFSPETGTELWKTDGTPEGTGPAVEVIPGPASSSPTQLYNANGTLYFEAYDGVH